MKLNHNQELAINTTDKNIVVAASAGGGKTTLLINRLTKRIVSDRISLDEIIAITFTEYAAINMKKRLIKSLKQALNDAKNDEESNFINQQLSLVDNSNISTIHSLCLKIIKEYHLDIDLKLEACNNILTDEFKFQYLNQAFELSINGFKGFSDLITYLSSDLYHFDSLKKYVIKIINTANNLNNPLKWLNDQKINSTINTIHDIDKNILDMYLSFIYKKIELIENIANNYLNENENQYIEQFLKNLKHLKELLDNNYKDFVLALGSAFSLKILKNDQGYKQLTDTIAEFLDEIAEYVMPEKDLINSYNHNIYYHNLLIDLCIKVYQNFQDIKKENHCIDFNDIEHYAYTILTKDNQKIAQQYKTKFKEIMIDEFQDTSSLQWDMIKSFAQKNLFIVGDIKQSIYRFRGANPDILNQVLLDNNFLKINIKENYRSDASIINFNNDLFKKTMIINNPNLKKEQIIQDVGLEKHYENNEKIRFIKAQFEDLENGFLIDDSNDEHQVLTVINEIKRLKERNIAYKDIVILVRSHSDKHLIKQVFDYYNIPYFIDDKSSYLNSLGVELIISFLKLIIQPNNKEALISLLLSPLYEEQIEELLIQKNLWTYLKKVEHPILNDIQKLNLLFKENKIYEMISYILKINNLYFNYLNIQQQTNVDYFIEKIESYKDLSIIEIIRLLEETLDLQSDISFAVSKEDDVVRVMTIHQSKGLEFDYVILFSKQKRLTNTDNVVTNEKLGIGFDYVLKERKISTPSFLKRTINWINTLEDRDEYLRLLYVALTRAVKQLIIVDSMLKTDYHNQVELIFHKGLGFGYYIDYMQKNDLNNHFELIEDDYDFNYDFNIHSHFIDQEIISEIKTFNNTSKAILQTSPSKLKEKAKLNFNTQGTSVGDTLHHIMEEIDFKKTYNPDFLVTNYNISLSHAKSIINFLNSDLIKNYLACFKEYSFYKKEDNAINHGFVDLILEFDSKILIIDYKSDNLEHEEEFIDSYHLQLKSYVKIATEIFKHKEIEAYIYSFKLSKFIKIKL